MKGGQGDCRRAGGGRRRRGCAGGAGAVGGGLLNTAQFARNLGVDAKTAAQ